MANKILTKKSSTAGAEPTSGDLDVGELAVNTSDGTLFTKHSDGSVKAVGSSPTHTHDYAPTVHTHTNSIDHLTDVDVTTTAPTADQVLKYDGTNWIPGDDVAGSGGTTNLTAGVIWDNHSTTAYDYTNDGVAGSSGTTSTDITVVADKTAVLTHTSDTEEMRSVYIEKKIQPTATGNTVTANGDAQHSTTKAKFGASSIKFAGGGTSWLDVDNSSGWDSFGTSDFTIDFWINKTSNSLYGGAITFVTDSSNRSHFNTGGSHSWGSLFFGQKVSGSWTVMASSHATLTVGTWYHVALVRSSLAFKIYVDGVDVSETETAFTGSVLGRDICKVGFADDNAANAYFDEFRISSTARWTTGFTPPTSAHIPDASTLLLIQSDTTVNESTAFTDTVLGPDPYWQLESFDDWGVQFTSPTTTTLVNNTTADAVIRARITKPTSVSTNAYGALELTTDGAVISPTAGILVTDATTKAITHTEDASNLRSVYIEKFVEVAEVVEVIAVPESAPTVRRIILDVTLGFGTYPVLAGLKMFSEPGVQIPMTIDSNTRYVATFNGGWFTITSTNTYNSASYYIGNIVGAGTVSGESWIGTAGASPTITIEFNDTVAPYPTMSSIEAIVATTHSSTNRGGKITAGRFYDENLVQIGDTIAIPYHGTLGLVHSRDTGIPNIPAVPGVTGVPAYTYWQLETYNDWGVQFTDPETTTITNNTGADATARFRITAPTAAASGSGGGATTLAELTDSTTATTDPLVTSNLAIGHFWINSASGEAYVCTDATADNNIWTNVGDGVDSIVPNDPPGNPTNTTIADQAEGTSFNHTFTGGTDADGTVTHYLVDTLHSSLTVATAEVAAESAHVFTIGTLTAGTSLTFRVRSKDNYGAYSSGVTVTFNGTVVPQRGVFGGGTTGSSVWVNNIDYITIPTTGNATDFGNLSVSRGYTGACSNGSRGVFGGGYNGGYLNTIDYITIATTGNATDFGNLLMSRIGVSACADDTRGVFGGGYASSVKLNILDYITIATTGNAIDFGDLTTTTYFSGACADATRGVFGGGMAQTTGDTNIIGYITIATTGNATDFGDLTVTRRALSACANGTRGVFGGGYNKLNHIDYITLATTGNATDFGDLTEGRTYSGACADGTRGVWGGGDTYYKNEIDYITIATTGNATNFGDLNLGRYFVSACSGV